MKAGVIGNGGREHAICFSLKCSHKIKKIYSDDFELLSKCL